MSPIIKLHELLIPIDAVNWRAHCCLLRCVGLKYLNAKKVELKFYLEIKIGQNRDVTFADGIAGKCKAQCVEGRLVVIPSIKCTRFCTCKNWKWLQLTSSIKLRAN